METTIKWEGRHAFFISGTEHDDTVRIEAVRRDSEDRLVLTLPTLCITYADMAFANDIGGEQEDYPASRAYGPRFFDPPVQISGGVEIEKYTWITGAEKVVIGKEETTIEWWGFHPLVIPRLRIGAGEKAEALLHVAETEIHVTQPFEVETKQYADGRHTGGVRLVKRHPKWEPEPEGRNYDLWVRTMDGESRAALPEVEVSLFTWSDEDRRFAPAASWYTDGRGVVDAPGLPCAEKQLVIAEMQGWTPRTWRFRPLPGQAVRQVFRLWPIITADTTYVWGDRDTLEGVAEMSASEPPTILALNRIRDASEIEPGRELRIPCVAPIYRVDARDSIERIAEQFCYSEMRELMEPNGLRSPVGLREHQGLKLEGWRFFRAGHDDAFSEYDRRFGLATGWSRPAQRTLHDAPNLAYHGELVAVPTPEFAAEHELRGTKP